MTAPLSANEISVNLRIDGSNEVISFRQAKWLLSQVKNEHCTPSCLICHFNARYLRELEPEVIESLLANDTNQKFRISEWDISRIVAHFEEGLPTDGEGRPVYPDTIAPPRPEGHHINSLPTTPIWRSTEVDTFPLLPIYSPRPGWNGVGFRHPREVAAEPPTYTSLGDAIQPPAYIDQVSRNKGGSIGSSVVNVDNVRTELETLTANSTPSFSPRRPEESATHRLDLEVSNPHYEALQTVLDAAAAEPTPAISRRHPLRWTAQRTPGEKYDYNAAEHQALPSYEEVIEWLHLPQLERQSADVASLEAMVQQEIERMDQLVDQLFTDFGDDAFQNPRSPPAIPGRSPALHFTPLPSPLLSTTDFAAFPRPPTSSDGRQWLEYMPPGTRLRGFNDSATDYWASDIGRLATVDDLEPRERQRWDEEARSSLQLSNRTLGHMVDWLSTRDHREDGQEPPISPTTAALATEPMPPAIENPSLSESGEVLIAHAASSPEPSSPIPNTLLPGSAPQPTEVNLEPVVSRYSPTPSEESFADYINNADGQVQRDEPQQHEQQEPHGDPSARTEFIAYQPANAPPHGGHRSRSA